MNVEDLVRTSLHDAAEQAAPIPDLYATAVQLGRRRRSTRRAATAGGVAISVAAIAGIGVVVANGTAGSGHHRLHVAGHGDGAQQVVADPWWGSWTTDRYYGDVSAAYLAAARPTYDVNAGPERIRVFAAGTMPDGTQWAMFTDETSPHVMQWLQGWGDHPNFGESSGKAEPDLMWTSWSVPTHASQDGSPNLEEWLIVVGRPGTTAIDYSPDGNTWQPLDVEHGIGVMKVTTPTGFPPAAAKVRMTDASGVYATGTPAGAGANAEPSASPTPDDDAAPSATPSATPTSMREPASATAR